MPAPEAVHPVVAFFPDPESGCAGLERVIGERDEAAALDYLDAGTLELTGAAFPGDVPSREGFGALAGADGGAARDADP